MEEIKLYSIDFDFYRDNGWHRYIDLYEFQGLIVFDSGVRNDTTLEEASNEGFCIDADSAEKVVETLQKLIKSIQDKTTDGRK